jgi:putative transcriptional regulator
MDFYSMTDRGIADEVGARVKSLRLRRNRTQQQVADATAISLNAVKALESGKAKLTTLIAVLRELGALEGLDALVPELAISPLQLAKQQGKARRRASGKRERGGSGEKVAW